MLDSAGPSIVFDWEKKRMVALGIRAPGRSRTLDVSSCARVLNAHPSPFDQIRAKNGM